ncbi:MAG: hypothetical protein Q7S23_04410 [bacterium]|nr:hypothetical protein [bacterium]
MAEMNAETPEQTARSVATQEALNVWATAGAIIFLLAAVCFCSAIVVATVRGNIETALFAGGGFLSLLLFFVTRTCDTLAEEKDQQRANDAALPAD